MKPPELWSSTPREVNALAKAYQRRIFEQRKRDRTETGIICTYLANSFGTKKVTFRSVMSGMEITDPAEKKKVQIWKGTQLQQLEQLTDHLREQGKL